MVSKAKLVIYEFVVVWSDLVYGEIWGQLEKSTPPSSTSEGQKGTGDDDDDLL